MPQKFHRGRLRCDSGLFVAVVHATPDGESSSSEQGRACTSAAVNRCRRHINRHHSVRSDTLAERQ